MYVRPGVLTKIIDVSTNDDLLTFSALGARAVANTVRERRRSGPWPTPPSYRRQRHERVMLLSRRCAPGRVRPPHARGRRGPLEGRQPSIGPRRVCGGPRLSEPSHGPSRRRRSARSVTTEAQRRPRPRGVRESPRLAASRAALTAHQSRPSALEGLLEPEPVRRPITTIDQIHAPGDDCVPTSTCTFLLDALAGRLSPGRPHVHAVRIGTLKAASIPAEPTLIGTRRSRHVRAGMGR